MEHQIQHAPVFVDVSFKRLVLDLGKFDFENALIPAVILMVHEKVRFVSSSLALLLLDAA